MGAGMSNTGMRMEIAESEASSYWTCFPTQLYGDVDHWGEGGSVCAWTAPWICGKAFETPSGHVFAKVGLAMPDWDYGVGLPIEISNSYGIHEFKTNGRTKDPEISLVNVTDFQEELPGYEAGIFSEQFLHEKNMPSVVVDNTNHGAFGIFGMVYAEKVAYHFTDFAGVVVSILGDVSCTPLPYYYRDRKVKF